MVPNVEFGPGGFAYRPGELLVRAAVEGIARDALDEYGEAEEIAGEWVLVTGLPNVLEALATLHGVGIAAQPNHVLFATTCCPPHPATGAYGANPFLANPFLANPFLANPFLANPFLANPFLANPFLANTVGGGCCCCGGSAGGAGGVGAKPFLANATHNPAAVPRLQNQDRLESTARPAEPGEDPEIDPKLRPVRVAILDTGYAQSFQPKGLPGLGPLLESKGGDNPDEDGDGYLDPVAGHGTFIAGVIHQNAPGCHLELHQVLSTKGDGGEAEIGHKLFELASRRGESKVDIVNLSFGAYSPLHMAYLADAIAELQRRGVVVVASAGNEATCVPTYPAVLPGVIGVGAVDADEWPAAYTNYGPWVRASSWGTDIVSIFFDGYDGNEPAVDGVDIDAFNGWARWSGTSFAAPHVVAAIAKKMQGGMSAAKAVGVLIDDEQLPRHPMLGVLIRP